MRVQVIRVNRNAGMIRATCALALFTGISPARAQTRSAQSDKASIAALEGRYLKGFNARDVDTIMSIYAPGDQLYVFDAVPPRSQTNWDSVKKGFEALFAAYPGPLDIKTSDLQITPVGPLAYAHLIESGYFTRKDGSRFNYAVRRTEVYRKIKGKWFVVHEHVSWPVDPESGMADLLSKP